MKPDDLKQCITRVWDKKALAYRQCYRKRGHGRRGLHCQQHAKIVEQAMGCVLGKKKVRKP